MDLTAPTNDLEKAFNALRMATETMGTGLGNVNTMANSPMAKPSPRSLPNTMPDIAYPQSSKAFSR